MVLSSFRFLPGSRVVAIVGLLPLLMAFSRSCGHAEGRDHARQVERAGSLLGFLSSPDPSLSDLGSCFPTPSILTGAGSLRRVLLLSLAGARALLSETEGKINNSASTFEDCDVDMPPLTCSTSPGQTSPNELDLKISYLHQHSTRALRFGGV